MRARPFMAPVMPSGLPVVLAEETSSASWAGSEAPSVEGPIAGEATAATIASGVDAVEQAIATERWDAAAVVSQAPASIETQQEFAQESALAPISSSASAADDQQIAEVEALPAVAQEPAVLEIPSWAGQSTAAGFTEVANTAEMAAIVEEEGADAAAHAHTAELAAQQPYVEAAVAMPSPAEAVGWEEEDGYDQVAQMSGDYAGIAVEEEAASSASSDVIDEQVVGNIVHDVMSHAGETSAIEVERLKEMEPWVVPATDSSVSEAATAIADALERVAERLRSGDVELIAGMPHDSDEGALAAALASLLRLPRR